MSTEYKLITYEINEIRNFIEEIKKHLSNGWELKGDLNCQRNIHQVLVKNNKNTQNRVVDYIIFATEGIHTSDSYRPKGIERIPNFNKIVNKLLSDKWELYGNIVVGDTRECWSPNIYQALIKYSPTEEDLLKF